MRSTIAKRNRSLLRKKKKETVQKKQNGVAGEKKKARIRRFRSIETEKDPKRRSKGARDLEGREEQAVTRPMDVSARRDKRFRRSQGRENTLGCRTSGLKPMIPLRF